MCRGLDLLPDWDTPRIRDQFNFWGGVCKQHQTHLASSSSRGKHQHSQEKGTFDSCRGCRNRLRYFEIEKKPNKFQKFNSEFLSSFVKNNMFELSREVPSVLFFSYFMFLF